MTKYQFKDKIASTDYWSYCGQHQIPYIVISPKENGYANISYDLLPCIPFDELKGDVATKLIRIYKAYSDFFKIPKDIFDYAGGNIALGFTVKIEHAEFIADQLFDYLSDYVATNKKPLA